MLRSSQPSVPLPRSRRERLSQLVSLEQVQDFGIDGSALYLTARRDFFFWGGGAHARRKKKKKKIRVALALAC